MGEVAFVTIGLLTMFLIFIMVWAKRYRKCGPNEVMVIFGRKRRVRNTQTGEVMDIGFRVQKGGGAFVWPVLEDYKFLSLELMTIDVKTPEVYTVTGVPVTVDGVAQMKVKGDEISIRTASEQFLDKSQKQTEDVALQTLEGHLRAIIGKMTVEELYKDRDKFAQLVQQEAATDFANMGLQVVSFTIREIRDSQGYLDALGKPRIAQVKRDAIIGQADADRDATIRSAQAHQEAQKERFAAETQVAESQRDYEMNRADYQASVNLRKAESDLAYDLQKNKTQQGVKVEEMKVLEIEKERLIEIKAKELEATVQKPADAERYRVQTLADAEKYKTIQDAEAKMIEDQNLGKGRGESLKAEGLGQAEATRAKGLAEAQVIQAKGEAEAEAMEKKAAAWRGYNEAAIAQMFIERLPDLAKAVAEPLGRTDKITIVSAGGGNGDGIGASKLTRDVVDIIAQLPPVLEGVSGMNLKDLITRLPSISKTTGDTPT